MVLQVAWVDFADTVKRLVGENADAYICPHNGVTLATSSKVGDEVVVAALSTQNVEHSSAELQAAGINVYPGRWAADLELEQEGIDMAETYVAGVAYKRESGAPGLWIDAYPSAPTQMQVLKRMYDEFSRDGEMASIAFEEFVRLAEATVVVTKPDDIRRFVTENVNAEAKPS
ncbi:hypothetical protein BH11ARM1_BH11ARM1_07830 [soil metagenome]